MKDPLILHLETSTSICSVALSRGNNLLSHHETKVDKSHSSVIIDFISSVLQESNESKNNLDAISCSIGPGSYTGLRIGLSTAKGLAYGLKIPIIDISVLDALANEMMDQFPEFNYYIPVIDARRMEVYLAIYKNKKRILDFKPMIIENPEVFDFLEKDKKIILSGYGVEKLSTVLQDSRFFIEKSIKPNSLYLIKLAVKKYMENNLSDTAYLSPTYLK